MISRYPRCAWSFQTLSSHFEPSSPVRRRYGASLSPTTVMPLLSIRRERIICSHSSPVNSSPNTTAAISTRRKKPCVTTTICSSLRCSKYARHASDRFLKSSKFSSSEYRYPGRWKFLRTSSLIFTAAGSMRTLPYKMDGCLRSPKRSDCSTFLLSRSAIIPAVSIDLVIELEITISTGSFMNRSATMRACSFPFRDN